MYTIFGALASTKTPPHSEHAPSWSSPGTPGANHPHADTLLAYPGKKSLQNQRCFWQSQANVSQGLTTEAHTNFIVTSIASKGDMRRPRASWNEAQSADVTPYLNRLEEVAGVVP